MSLGRNYKSLSFWCLSGTGSGAVKVAIRPSGSRQEDWLVPSPNRIALNAISPHKIENVAMSGAKVWCSGTTNTVTLLINAWDDLR